MGVTLSLELHHRVEMKEVCVDLVAVRVNGDYFFWSLFQKLFTVT